MNGCGCICHPHIDSTHILSLTKLSWRRKIKPEVEKHWREPGVVQGSQHRFRQGRLCSTILLEPSESITAVTDQRDPLLVLHSVFSKSIGRKNLHQRWMGRTPRLELKMGVQEQQQSRRKEQECHCTFAHPVPLQVRHPALPGLQHLWDTTDLSPAESAENSLYRKLLINFIWLKLESEVSKL